MLDGADPNAIVFFGSIVLIVLVSIAGSIIKSWIKGRSGNLTENQEFLAALREFKEKTDQRLTRIENVIDDLSGEKALKEKPPVVKAAKQEKRNLIDIEIENYPEETESKGKEKLKNMLD